MSHIQEGKRMPTHHKQRQTSRTHVQKATSADSDLLPLSALGGLAFGFLAFFLGAEVVLFTRPHPLHWLTAAGGGALLYLIGLFYARRKASHPRSLLHQPALFAILIPVLLLLGVGQVTF